VAGGFTADDFTVDPSARTVSCPAGITRHLTAKNAVIFGVACRDCPLRERCTTAKDGRTLHLHQHDGLLRAARAVSCPAGSRRGRPGHGCAPASSRATGAHQERPQFGRLLAAHHHGE